MAGSTDMSQAATVQDSNKALVRAGFERWAQGTGSPFELHLPDAQWTIVGSSPLSKTYHGVRSLLDEVIPPSDARMRTPLVPTGRGFLRLLQQMGVIK
jgi:ketosteroid isomerase-like protein